MARKVNRRIDVLYIRNIPKDVKDRFKAACARRGVSMNKQINRMMVDFIKEEAKD